MEAIFAQLQKLWAEFETAHNGTKKKDTAIARKALGEIKKLVTPYRAESVAKAAAAKAKA